MSRVENLEHYIRARSLDPRLTAALNDDPITSEIITSQCKDALVGSRLFNVVTAVYNIHRKHPARAVLSKPLRPPKEVKADPLLASAISALNVGHVAMRGVYEFASKPTISAGTCAQSELLFWKALSTQGLEEGQEPSTLFVDSEGKTIFAKKEEGQPTALSFKKTIINGLAVPPGTIFSLTEHGSMPSTMVRDFKIMPADMNSIERLAPLRLSAYAIEPNKREKALTPMKEEYNIPGQSALTIGAPRFVDVRAFLPPREELAEAYKACQQ